ncbi:MAG: hypothetical protein K2O45_10040, partial [Oscillospiraceae bacterium]|nr:hypothetical protein [Oscillospiraceae bacterium]
QKYYTTPTSSVQDQYGNVTNYYRGGDTTTTNIIDSYNKTFNTIHNTTNNTTTNNYKANVKLENFLNQYTTNNNNYTYSADFKSWYYDNTTNNYNYTTNNLYYNQDNSRYYLTIDNSTDEYYLIDVQYSPTFVTVNYTYNNTVNNNQTVGDVTNVYYYELKDGRNSSSLTAAEVAGMDFGYDVVNYELVTDDPNTLSLQHFDGNYTDSSSYGRTFYSENRSSQYVDSGAFGQAVKLSSGSAAGVTIPNLSNYDSLTFDFRVYYADISDLGIYFGDTNIFQRIPTSKSATFTDYYTDHGNTVDLGQQIYSCYNYSGAQCPSYLNNSLFGSAGSNVNLPSFGYSYSNTLRSTHTPPSANSSSGWSVSYSSKYGWYQWTGSVSSPTVNSYQTGSMVNFGSVGSDVQISGYNHVHKYANFTSTVTNYRTSVYRVSGVTSIPAEFSYSSYKNQWLSMRVTISGGKLYYFVNGDLVGSGAFTKPTADKFYIKSTGTVYLDELRVTTGSLSSTSVYTPPSAPYDTNKVLALPDDLKANTIYVQHATPVTNHRIGGVRPSNPATGFFYILLYDDNTGGQPQLYDGSNWVDVTAMVYDGKTLHDAKGFKFSPVGSFPDVDIDAKPERPEKPGDDADPDACTHDWTENIADSVAPTCTLAGAKSYICSKCEKTKLESVPLLDHDWMVKATFPNQYDDEGNQVSVGFTIFECLRCQEQYKSVDGTAPPPLSPGSSAGTPGGDGSGDSEEEEGFLSWLLRKAGELLGAVGKGVIDFLRGVLSGIFDGLISLVESVFENLTKLVDLFGSFGDALGVLWTWLPSEIMLVLVAGVSVFVLVALLKLFMK